MPENYQLTPDSHSSIEPMGVMGTGRAGGKRTWEFVPHDVDRVRTALELSYSAELAALARIGVKAPMVQDVGANNYALEAGAGLAADGSRVSLSATNAAHTLTSSSHQSHVWFASILDCDTMQSKGRGVAEALDVAVANAPLSMRSAEGATIDTRPRETANARPGKRESLALMRCEREAFTLNRGKTAVSLTLSGYEWTASGHCDGHSATSTFASISLGLDSVLAKLRTPNPEEFRIGLAEGYACLNSRQDR